MREVLAAARGLFRRKKHVAYPDLLGRPMHAMLVEKAMRDSAPPYLRWHEDTMLYGIYDGSGIKMATMEREAMYDNLEQAVVNANQLAREAEAKMSNDVMAEMGGFLAYLNVFPSADGKHLHCINTMPVEELQRYIASNFTNPGRISETYMDLIFKRLEALKAKET